MARRVLLLFCYYDICSVITYWHLGFENVLSLTSVSSKIGTICVPTDLHTEAVQAALAKYKERKMPMPSKRRSVLVQSSVEACTPPGKHMHTRDTYMSL